MGKHKRKEKKPKKINLKHLITGVSGTEDIPGTRFPNGTQSLVPFVDIQMGMLVTADGRYVKVIEVLPTNFYLKSDMEQQNIIHYFAGYLKIAPISIQILIRTDRADVDTYCEQMDDYCQEESNERCRKMIVEDVKLVRELAAYEAITRHFYIVFQYTGMSTQPEEIAEELAEAAQTAYQYLDYCGLEVLRHEDYDEFLFRTLCSCYPRTTEIDYVTYLSQSAPIHGNVAASVNEVDEEDEIGRLTLQDVLAPSECDITHKDYLLIDGRYYAYLYVAGYSYPTKPMRAWLSPFVEFGDGISLSFFLDKKRREQILPKVAKTTMFNRSRMRDVDDTRADYEELDDAISSGFYIKEGMNRESEDFFHMHTLIEVTADDMDTLERRITQVTTLCTSIDFTVRRANYQHEQGFLSMLPQVNLDSNLEAKSRRNVLTTGAAGAFPFSSFALCDDKGVLLGINLHNNSTVILDNFNADIYSNGNMSIFGMTGAGKTFTMLLLAMRLRMCGVQVFIIAPEKGFEYRSACDALGGEYIKLSRGSLDCINIMDIRRTTLDIDSNMADHETRNDSVMLDMMQDIRTYIKLRYPAMTPEEGYQLNSAVMHCYEQFGITRDNHSLLQEDGQFKPMPTLADLYPILAGYPDLKNIAIVVKDLVDAGLGGPTNVNLTSSFVVIDTSSAREEEVSPLTFLGTVYIRDEMTRSRTRKKAVFGDELWKIAGSEGNEQAADFVVQLVKTIRGYGGIFVSATQNVIDYFALRDGKFGDTLLNNSRLKLLLQMEEAEAIKIKEKLGLSDEEVMQIVRCGRGQGLLCAGKNRIAVEIRSSQTQYDLITTNRSDLEKRENGNGAS